MANSRTSSTSKNFVYYAEGDRDTKVLVKNTLAASFIGPNRTECREVHVHVLQSYHELGQSGLPAGDRVVLLQLHFRDSGAGKLMGDVYQYSESGGRSQEKLGKNDQKLGAI